jgi:hypothetical protein
MHSKTMSFGWSCAVVIASGLLLLLPVALSSLFATTGDDFYVRTYWCCSLSLIALAVTARWLAASMHLAACVIALIALLMIHGAIKVHGASVI